MDENGRAGVSPVISDCMDRLPVDSSPREEHRASEELLDEASTIQQIESDELFWYDDHFGENEPSERMFNSLQLGSSSPAYDSFESPQHHSLDDMSNHCRRNDLKDFAASRKSYVKDDDNDDDDDDDIDMETMKNKFLSAWTNAKNG